MRGQLHSAMATVPTVDPATERDTGEIAYVRWLQQMQADLAETLGGVMLRGARPVQIGTADGGTMRPTSAPGRLVGWSIRETSGANPALVRLYNGRDFAAPLVACITPATGKADSQWFAPGGISLTEGLAVEFVSGAGLSTAIEGTVYLGAAE